MEINREALAWAAGIFEGEGTISLARSSPVLSVSSTDEDVLLKFHQIVQCGVVDGPYNLARKPKKGSTTPTKPFWQWRTYGFEKPQAVLALFWHWLCQRRRRRAREVLGVCKNGGVRNKYKKHCKRGHEFPAWKDKRGYRQCFTCSNLRRRAKRRGLSLDEFETSRSNRSSDCPIG